MMIRQSKKLFLGLLSLLAVFIIAGCVRNQALDKNANNVQQTQKENNPSTLTGEWESVDELESLQKAFFFKGVQPLTFGRFIEAFKDFKMKLKVDGGYATISYKEDVEPFAKAFYSIAKDKDKYTEDEFVKMLFGAQTEFASTFKKYTVSMDEKTGIYSYAAKGTIDEQEKKVTFPEGFTIFNSFQYSVDERQTPVTFNYEIKDGILYLYDDARNEDGLPVRFELRFKPVQNQEKK